MAEYVTVADLVKAGHLDVVSGQEYLDERKITVSDISRPGLELTGYFNYYPHERIQLFGRTETSYTKNMAKDSQVKVLERMCTPDTPAFVVSRGLSAPDEMIAAASKAHIPVLSSQLPTTRLVSLITDYLDGELAERDSIHGVLVEIFGMGILITGESGIGKSETALELVQRGHRLIADDRVDVHQQDETTVIGEAPKILDHMLEIRGVGIIDVMDLFGAGAVRSATSISLIVHLENWSDDKTFDRLGTGEDTQEIMNVPVPRITVPVRVGRNLAIIIEVAAMNFRAKRMGFDATEKFKANLAQLITHNEEEDEAR
ncbi:HPr(Ser) kinase/phosphatase [Lacticaseibacillus pantheris]|uniref:HPr kinase/phosphorylase n=1 Tax=Lacticaseibacillus pantheris DSM 15945 = JCM 12539 = NBRC 106106 TaxID=1423783 RepID=A0A0R1TXI3_9LACO|nr:HPr(Ser) kinase/phosphatase [Lacticaseibacillus pantheris]KRL84932.1 HPr kinase phosphorylase [Lacticaseibacillus pantheris DSM 15945 = JCM 12539 = NBRC 106106]WKF85764.1 HPr(Ser) kinase/phosphatase [Lacticaseibacillus pantheris]